MAYPTMALEIAFATTPFVAPTWVDVTSRLVGGSVSRGRTSELDRIRAGTLTVVLVNDDRRFDPTHAGGTYWPNVLPMRRIRLRATFSAVTYDLFTGYIDRWEQTYQPPGVAHATVAATDAFKVFAAKDLPASVYATEVLADNPAAWWRLGETYGTTALDSSGNGQNLTYANGPTFNSRSGLVDYDNDPALGFTGSEYAEGTPRGISSTAYTVEAWLRIPPVDGPAHGDDTSDTIYSQTGGPSLKVNHRSLGTLGQVTFSDGGWFVESSGRVDNDTVHHVVGVRDAGGNLKVYVDGVDVTSGAAVGTSTPALSLVRLGRNSTSPVGADAIIGTLDDIAIYNTALSGARIAAHNDAGRSPWDGETSGTRVGRILDAIAWPAGDRTIDTGQSTLQATSLGGSVLSYLQNVEESEGGLLYITKDGKVRFRSRHGGFNLASSGIFGDGDPVTDLEYTDIAFDYSESLIYNEIRVTRAGGATQTAEDSTSQIAYGERTYTADGLLIETDAESADRANFLLGKYKDPVLRTTRMVVEPNGDATLFPQVLGREIGDKLTVRRKPQNVGVTIDQAVIIEGMQHEFRVNYWRTEFALSPSSSSSTPGAGDADYLQLDDTDGPGLGFVRLAY